MRNHNKKGTKDQFPWSFNDENAIKVIKNTINCRYSLLRYMYSQLFLISLNEKGSFFKPVMFEFPEDDYSYEDIESKIMFGEAFLLCAFYDVNENDKEFILPNSTCFNRYPSGKSIINEVKEGNKIKLSGKLDEVHLFLREGFIVPKQNTFEKYILNTMKLREEKIDLIINIDCDKRSQGVLFFDNDDRNTIKDNAYYRVELNFTNDKLSVKTYKNNLTKYDFNDHLLGNIELWNLNNIIDSKKEEKKDKKYSIEINYKAELKKGKENIEGNYDDVNDKIIYDFKKKEKDVSLFDIENILFNF
jgi:alpha-glucosidase (family GH31 glycosyl hydrolase)